MKQGLEKTILNQSGKEQLKWLEKQRRDFKTR